MTGTVTETFSNALTTYAWAYIAGQWYQISQEGGPDSVTNMFTQLVAARSSGIQVTVDLDASNQIIHVFY